MAYEPKLYRKPGKPDRIARTASDAVQLVWDGYKHVKTEEPASVSEVVVPQLTEEEMAKLPDAKDAEVVDLTDDGTAPKPKFKPASGRTQPSQGA